MKIRWNTFEGRQFGGKGSGPRVSLDRHGVFYLNDAAWRVMGEPEAVELLVDDSCRIFGFKPTDPKRPNAFQLRKHAGERGGYRRISGAAFFQHLKIRIDRTLAFQDIELDDEGILVLDMNRSTNVSRGAR